MNRGFKFYFEEGSKIAWKTFFPKSINIIKYYIFIMISSVASVCIFLQPLVKLAYVKLIQNIKNEEDVKLIDSIEGVEKPKRLWTIFIFELIILVILMIFQIPLINLCFSSSFIKAIQINNYETICLILNIFIVILFSVFLIVEFVINCLFFPSIYIINEKDNLSVSKLMKESLRTSKGNRMTFLAIYLTMICILLGSVLAIILLIFLLSTDIIVLIIISTILMIILIIGLIVFGPWLTVTCSVASYLLYEDIKTKEEKEIKEDNYKEILIEFLKK